MNTSGTPWMRIGVLTLLLIAAALSWWVMLAETTRAPFTVAFLDVGQGDAIFIEAPDHSQMLIDGGAGKAVLRELGKVMPFYDRSIDIVMATHPDADHIGGLPRVLDRYDVSLVLTPGRPRETRTYDAFTERIAREGAQHIHPRRGMRIALSEHTHFDILFPDRPVAEIDANASSIVGRLTHKDRSVLLTGDSPKAIERFLLEEGAEHLSADVLKVGHHGSDTSSARAFLSAVDPKRAIISAAEDNPHGHPHEEVVERLAVLNITQLNTASSGTIIFESEGGRFQRVR